MNITEGMRRIAIALGCVGGIAGAFAGYQIAHEVWKTRSAYSRFESFADSPAIQKDRKDLLDTIQKDWFARNASPEERKKLAALDETGHGIGVERFTLDPSTGTITSIDLSTGESLQRTKEPSRMNYAIFFIGPTVGFLVPWGVIRVFAWILAGFSK